MDAIIAAVKHWLAADEKHVNYIESRDRIFEVPVESWMCRNFFPNDVKINIGKAIRKIKGLLT